MSVEQLIYTSQTTDKFQYEDISSILMSARENNYDREISGALCYLDSFFIQLLEGTREEINRLLFKIAQDPRHHDLQIRHYGQAEERLFAKWSMCHIDENEFKSIIPEEPSVSVFEQLTPEKSFLFFKKLSQNARSG